LLFLPDHSLRSLPDWCDLILCSLFCWTQIIADTTVPLFPILPWLTFWFTRYTLLRDTAATVFTALCRWIYSVVSRCCLYRDTPTFPAVRRFTLICYTPVYCVATVVPTLLTVIAVDLPLMTFVAVYLTTVFWLLRSAILLDYFRCRLWLFLSFPFCLRLRLLFTWFRVRLRLRLRFACSAVRSPPTYLDALLPPLTLPWYYYLFWLFWRKPDSYTFHCYYHYVIVVATDCYWPIGDMFYSDTPIPYPTLIPLSLRLTAFSLPCLMPLLPALPLTLLVWSTTAHATSRVTAVAGLRLPTLPLMPVYQTPLPHRYWPWTRCLYRLPSLHTLPIALIVDIPFLVLLPFWACRLFYVWIFTFGCHLPFSTPVVRSALFHLLPGTFLLLTIWYYGSTPRLCTFGFTYVWLLFVISYLPRLTRTRFTACLRSGLPPICCVLPVFAHVWFYTFDYMFDARCVHHWLLLHAIDYPHFCLVTAWPTHPRYGLLCLVRCLTTFTFLLFIPVADICTFTTHLPVIVVVTPFTLPCAAFVMMCCVTRSILHLLLPALLIPHFVVYHWLLLLFTLFTFSRFLLLIRWPIEGYSAFLHLLLFFRLSLLYSITCIIHWWVWCWFIHSIAWLLWWPVLFPCDYSYSINILMTIMYYIYLRCLPPPPHPSALLLLPVGEAAWRRRLAVAHIFARYLLPRCAFTFTLHVTFVTLRGVATPRCVWFGPARIYSTFVLLHTSHSMIVIPYYYYYPSINYLFILHSYSDDFVYDVCCTVWFCCDTFNPTAVPHLHLYWTPYGVLPSLLICTLHDHLLVV